MIELTPEERKQAYITLVHEEYKPVKYKWWKSTRIYYHFTKDLARDNYKKINRIGPVEFKKGKASAIIAAVIFVLSIGGTFFIDRFIGFFTLFSLLIFLIVLPRFFDKKIRIRITRNGIWIDGLQNEISWGNVLITCVKEVENGDNSVFTLIIHYYDLVSDGFLKAETRLDQISAYHLAATIEYYRSEYIPAYCSRRCNCIHNYTKTGKIFPVFFI